MTRKFSGREERERLYSHASANGVGGVEGALRSGLPGAVLRPCGVCGAEATTDLAYRSGRCAQHPVRVGNWTHPEPDEGWLLDGANLRLEYDRQYGWVLWGEIDGVYPDGHECGRHYREAFIVAEAWAAGQGWEPIR